MVFKPTITIDGTFSDWIASERIDYGDQPGYSLYATAQNGFLYFDLNAPVEIGANTTVWLNTDLNAATGYQIFGYAGGAEYNVNFYTKIDGTIGAALYTGADGQTLVLDNIPIAYSADHTSVEFAIPMAAAGNPNNPIDVLYDVNNSIFGPVAYTNQPYVAPNADVTRTPTHRVAIVYSDTTAANYFRGIGDAAGAPSTVYSDLFMAAQNQARMAGVSYDVIDESQLTDINNLIGYDALVFPAMTDVNTAQLPAIMSALTSAVYDYHIGIITSGDFLTNDQTGAPLANPYINMETLLGLTRASGGNSGDVTVTAADVSNPIMKDYTANQLIQSYSGIGYTGYQAVGITPYDVLVNQNVATVGTVPGVVETTVGGATNVHFATQALLGDNNLLSNAIQSIVLGTGPGVALHTSRGAGIVAARMDMDQAQVPADVSPAGGGPGIYDQLIPILQQWKALYDFTGSYYLDIGNQPNADDPTTTDWTKSLVYYEQILSLGGEIGTHSYTHLINPPITTFTAHTVGGTAAGSTTITLDQVPSFYGITVGMWLTGTGIGSNTQLPGAAGEGGATASTQVIAVDNVNKTITISYVPAGFGGTNQGTIASIPAGTTLTFSVPPENTNFLEPVTGTDLSAAGTPFTYQYEFGDSKTLLQQMLGIPIYGAAVPGAGENAVTSQNILQYFPSGAGYTGYVTGGWTGIGSGYPSAIGYINPTQQGSVYIAPNITFDFTEVQYQGKTVAQAEADWAAQLSALTSHAAGTPIVVWPIHDYGAAAWNTTTNSPTGSPYTTQMYADFISQAYSAGYEFVTLEELASRIAAQEKAHIDYTTSGNAISVTITPDASAPDLGAMALDVVNDGTEVIQNVTNWYAYNAQELFLPRNGGLFTINLGTAQDDVTHITALPMRGDLLSVTGDGLNLSFAMVGDGQVVIDLGNHGAITPLVSLTGGGSYTIDAAHDQLDLSFIGLGEHDVSVLFLANVTAVAFSADSGASASDFITNVAAQTITGTLSGPLGAGDVVQVSLDNGATWLTAAADAGGMSFSLAAVLLSGSNTLLARVAAATGATGTQFTQAYVLDQVPPAEAVTIVAMTADSLVTGDFITNNGSAGRTVLGTLSASLAADETLQVSFDGGSSWISAIVAGTAWSVIDAGSHSASWTIEGRVVDLAGNTGTLASRAVTLDITPPSALLAMAAASDSGPSSSDAITKIARPVFAGVTEAGSAVALFDGASQIGAATAGADGAWSITPAASLANGTHTIRARVTDLAGNVAQTSPALVAVIDTVAPAGPSVPDLIAASDTGVSQTDNYTRIATPTFAGTAETGSTVTLFDGTILIGSGVATSGSWSIASTVPLTDGTHSISAKATDLAGNVSIASAALAVKIDTKAPLISAPDLIASSDSGASSTDNITRIAAPVFAGTAESGSVVKLFDGAVQIGSATASAGGSWTIASSSLADGSHTITASATDAAGNASAASAGLSVVVDTRAPAPPLFSGLTVNSNGSVTLAGSVEPSGTVALADLTAQLGTTIAGGTGVWSFKTGVLSDTIHVFTATATDRAGNVGASGGSAQLGSSGADTLVSTSGNDLLMGQSGSDTFSFLANFANDVISDFVSAGARHDVINFHANAVLNSFASVLHHAVQSGSSVMISQDAANTLTLKNATLSSLSAADFSFS